MPQRGLQLAAWWIVNKRFYTVFAPGLFCRVEYRARWERPCVIHECPACTCSTTIMGVKSLVPHYLGNLSPHSCRGPLCIIARNRNAWHPDTHTEAVERWAQLFAAWDELCRCPAPAADNGSRSCSRHFKQMSCWPSSQLLCMCADIQPVPWLENCLVCIV